MNFRFVFFLVAALSISLGLAGCRDSDRDRDDETVSSRDFLLAENYFNDIFLQVHAIGMVDSVLNAKDITNTLDTNCLDYTLSNQIGFPNTLTIDFGTSDSIPCADGRKRKGKIIANFTTRYIFSQAIFTITTSGYFLDGVEVTGTQFITGEGIDADGRRVYQVTIENGVLVGEDVDMTFDATLNRTWAKGLNTPDIVDDMFIISGEGRGRSSGGNTYAAEIFHALQMWAKCGYADQGQVILKVPGLNDRFIDYGCGCDRKATMEVKNRLYEFFIYPENT